MRAIEAVPTVYSGIEFRSRLEATWARVFDILHMKWVYEPRNYRLSCGTYTPDFEITSRRETISLEIKPTQLKELSREELEWTERAMRAFALEVGPTHLITSPPRERGLTTILRMEKDPIGEIWAGTAALGKCRYCGEYQIYKHDWTFGTDCNCNDKQKRDWFPIDDLCIVNFRDINYMADFESKAIMRAIMDINFNA